MAYEFVFFVLNDAPVTFLMRTAENGEKSKLTTDSPTKMTGLACNRRQEVRTSAARSDRVSRSAFEDQDSPSPIDSRIAGGPAAQSMIG
jgi:hypothetical protein